MSIEQKKKNMKCPSPTCMYPRLYDSYMIYAIIIDDVHRRAVHVHDVRITLQIYILLCFSNNICLDLRITDNLLTNKKYQRILSNDSNLKRINKELRFMFLFFVNNYDLCPYICCTCYLVQYDM